MLARIRFFSVAAVCSLLLLSSVAHAQPETKGQRVFYSGHSFHYFVPGIVADMAKKAGIKDHKQLGLSAIGGSRVYQHWNVPEAKNKAKEALKAGKVDVFTMAPIYLPDDGIENFVKLGIANNPKIRIFVQENWLPWDHYDVRFKAPKEKVDHNAPTVASLRKMHAPYFTAFDAHVAELNKKYETDAVHIAPIGQSVILLREKILQGKAPGLKNQNDLFTDAIGHARPPVASVGRVLLLRADLQEESSWAADPAILGKGNEDDTAALNRLLQEIAWQAVTSHPLSGVKGEKK